MRCNWRCMYILTILAGADIEEAVGGARGAAGAEAIVFGIVLGVSEHVVGGAEAITHDVAVGHYLLLEVQRQQTAHVLVPHVQRRVGRDVGREDGAVAAVQTVAALGFPVGKVGTPVKAVHQAVARDVALAGENGHQVLGGAVFLKCKKYISI